MTVVRDTLRYVDAGANTLAVYPVPNDECPAVALEITDHQNAEDDEPAVLYVRLADVDRVCAAIREAAESAAPTGQQYPAQIGVFCDDCGTAVEHDYLVSDEMDQAQRFEVARTHLRETEGWQCDEAGDHCPACKSATTEPVPVPVSPDGGV